MTRGQKVALFGILLSIIGSLISIAGVRDYGVLEPIYISDLGWAGITIFWIGVVISLSSYLIRDEKPVLDDVPSGPQSNRESEKEDEETLQWTFRFMRNGSLYYHGQQVATCNPVGLMGFFKYRGSYEGRRIILRSRANFHTLGEDVHILSIEDGQEIGILQTDTFQNPAIYVHANGVKYELRGEHVAPWVDWWWVSAPDGRKLSVTKADFHNIPKYTFRPLEIHSSDPSQWLFAVLSLYNILRFNFPS